MDDISGPIDIQQFIEAALECSIHFSPGAPGLSVPEIYECRRRAGLKDGEIGDVVLKLHEYGEDNRLLPSSVTLATATTFAWKEEPELRNIDAFDFVYGEMLAQMREVGVGAARLDRAPLVEQGAAAGIPRDAIEAAVTMLVLVGHFKAKGDTLSPAQSPGTSRFRAISGRAPAALGFQ